MKTKAEKPRMTFAEACARYVHRYTLEHVPQWALRVGPEGRFYAPQYATDREWYGNTLFPPHNPFSRKDCHSTGQTFPLGQWLDAPIAAMVRGAK